jgi:hypothetical protein
VRAGGSPTEWFTVEKARTYWVATPQGERKSVEAVAGEVLRGGPPITLGENETLRLMVTPAS